MARNWWCANRRWRSSFIWVNSATPSVPGTHTLSTQNIPILTTLRGWKYGFESPFKADVYYLNTRLFTGNKWGTSNPVMMRDADFGIVRVRAFGTYDFRIVQPAVFSKEVAGSDQHFRLDEFADTMRSRIVSLFSEALAQSKVPVLDLATRFSELGSAILPLINPVTMSRYGIQFTSFVLENVSVPPAVEQAVDARSSMSAVGNLNDYVKFQMAQGMAQPGGASGAAGFASEMAVGMEMARQIMQQQGGLPVVPEPSTPAPGASMPDPSAPPLAVPDLLSPAEAAQLLGVSEADVMQTLEAGELKGRKIGSVWRIPHAAVNEFLKG